MKKLTVAVHAALAAALLSSCATDAGAPGKSASTISLQPIQRTSDEASPEAWYQRGRYYQGQSRWAQAEASFRRVLEIDTVHAEAHNALGAVLAALGRLAAAESEFRAGSLAAPQSAHIRGNLGRVLLLQGKTDEAVGALEEALRLDPANRSVRINLHEALAKGGRGARPLLPARPDSPPPATENPSVQQVTVVTAAGPAVQVVPLASPSGAGPAAAGNAVVTTMAPAPGDVLTIAAVAAAPAGEPASGPQAGAVPPARSAAAGGGASAGAGELPPDPVAVRTPESAPTPAAPARAAARAADSVVDAEPPARLEVSNGNGVTGMARRVRQALAEVGLKPVRVTNQLPYRQQVTAIQYRAGFEPQARALLGRFSDNASVVYQPRLNARVDVRIVLGRELPRSFALNDPGPEGALRLAAVEGGER